MNRMMMGVLVTLPVLTLAQVPPTMSFTARLDDSGAPVSGSRSFTFRLFAAATGGTEVWSETQTLTVNAGAVSAELGAVTPLGPSVFTGTKLYLEVTVGTTTLTPRSPVVSVPYAYRANVASQVGSLSEANIQRRVASTCPANSAIRAVAADGTVTCETVSSVSDAGTTAITGVFGGSGLSGGGTSGSVTLNVAFGGNGSAATVSRSDHTHNYLPVGTALTCSGSQKMTGLNANGSVICGADIDTDTNTTYTAGAGLALNASTFSLASCPSGQILKSTGPGAWSCQADSGGSVTSVSGTAPISVTGTGALTVALTGTVPVSSGGTGATSASSARSALGAASSGANTDITSLGGLTTPLSAAQGGTGSTSLGSAVILNQTSSAQDGGMWVSGPVRTNGLLRLGASPTLPPKDTVGVYRNAAQGGSTLVPYQQLIRQVYLGPGQLVAVTDGYSMSVTPDGSDMVVTRTVANFGGTASCHGFSADGTPYTYYRSYDQADSVGTTYPLGIGSIVHLSCVMSSYLEGHHTEFTIHRPLPSFRFWTGILTSTLDQ